MSFRLKTILGIAIIEAVLLFILIISVLGLLRSSNEEELFKRAYTTAQLFASSTRDAVLATDLAALEGAVAAVLTNPGVVYARVAGDAVVLAEGGDRRLLARPFRADAWAGAVTDGVYDAKAPISVQGVTYGHVEVGLSDAAIETVLADARATTMTIAALEMVMVALFSSLLGRYLTRGLDALRHGAQRLGQGQSFSRHSAGTPGRRG